MTDDDDIEVTPTRERPITDSERTAHYAAYPPGTLPVRELVATPRNLFEKHLDERMERAERHIESLDASRRFWRWVAGLGIPALLSAAFVLVLYAADRITTSSERVGETRAQIAALTEQVKTLQQEVLMLLKLSGLDPTHTNATLTYQSPPKRK